MIDYFSMTLSKKQSELILKSLRVFRGETIIHGRKNTEFSLYEIDEIIKYIESQRDWKLDIGAVNL